MPDTWTVLYRADEDPTVPEFRDAKELIAETSMDGALIPLLVIRPDDKSIAVVNFAAHGRPNSLEMTSLDVIWGTVRYMESESRSFRIVGEPRAADLGSLVGATARYAFVANADTQDFSMLCDLWVFSFAGGFLQIGTTVAATESEILFEVREIIGSVELLSQAK